MSVDNYYIETIDDFRHQLKRCQKEKKIVILKAGAVWCQPCKQIDPFYQALMEHWSKILNICFLHFDIDKAQVIANYFEIQQIPFFICLLPTSHPTLTKKELRFLGSDPHTLEQWFLNIGKKWIAKSF
jgi:thiol-disulfide isomerase/thioredoxin